MSIPAACLFDTCDHQSEGANLMSGPFDNKGRGSGGVFPNLSDRLDRGNDHNVPQTALDQRIACTIHGSPFPEADDE